MDYRLYVILIFLCHTGHVLTRSVIKTYAKANQETKWIVFIGVKSTECAGVLIKEGWILTLGECVNSKQLSKLKVTFPDGKQRKVRAQERSKGDVMVLLKVDVDKKDGNKFAELASSSVPKSYKYALYNFNAKEVETAYDANFVGANICTKDKRLKKTFSSKQHSCLEAGVDRKNKCFPGFPVFGTKQKNIILQGLSTTGADFCASEVQSTVPVSQHKAWIENIIIDCGSPSKIKNGKVTLDDKSSSGVGAKANVQCQKGYEANPSTIKCKPSGEWPKATCDLIDCGRLPSIKNGDATLDKRGTSTFGATASIECIAGYKADKESISCKETGKWDKATCTIKDCGRLPSIKNGDATLHKRGTSTFGATASIECTARYKANKASISCKENGKWDKATCNIKDCGSLPSIKNGDATLDKRGTSTFGATASIDCIAGYKTDKASISCKENGKWDKATCTIKDCGSLPSIKDGTATLDDPGTSTFGATASIECTTGYETNKASISCKDNGKWDKTSCTIKDCGSLPSIKDGTATLDDSGTSTFGATASIECTAGYETNKASISCKDNGKWDKTSCTIKDCGSLPSIKDGTATLDDPGTSTFGATASIECTTGYETNKASISCKENGKWDKTSCTIKDCGSLPSVTSGTATLDKPDTSTFGATASIECTAGYETNKASISCKETGQWDKSTCTIKDCGKLPTISDGSAELDDPGTSTFGATASISCTAGYETKKASISCKENGKWDKSKCTIKDCGSSLTILNGNLIFTKTTFGSTASVTCDAGYNASSATIDCLDIGSWETSSCIIKDCGSSLTVSNGSLAFTNTTFGSTANLICDAGFTENGATIDCLDTGSWETPTCTIKDCGSSLTVSNGSVAFTTTTFGSTASLTCDDGFTESSATIDCLDTGSWETPTCTIKDCGSSLTVSNGSVTFTSTTFGSIASITCDAGFTANSATVDCLDTGSWETPTCTIKDCGSSLTVSNGTLSFTTTTFGSTANLICDAGFTANSASIDCLDTGSWETPSCIIKDCGSSLTVSNGSLTFTTTTFGSTASVSCDAGFTANSATIDCLDTGSWETPTCTIEDCGSSLTVSNGSLTFSNTTFGSTASLTCDSGFTANSATIDCLDTGSWETPTCTIKDCGSSLTVSNGSLTFTSTTFGSTASVTCDSGYDTDSATIDCLDTGSWETPKCTIKDCGSSLTVSNGTLSFTTTTFRSTASVTCDSGFTENSATIDCLDTGSWETPTCTIKDCGSSLTVTNGSLTFSSTTYGSTASVICETGFNANKATIDCLDTGSWETPTCTIKDCGSSLTVSNGSLTFTSTTYESTASLTCDAGFTANSATIDCLDTGSWETPTCTIKDCGSSLTVSNGTLSFTTTTFGSTASVTCDAGFTAKSATIDCLDTGSWETPTCTIKDCGSSLTVSNGTLSFTTTTFGSSASLTCDAGFTANSATIDCLDTGSWETPTCTIKDCGSALTVSNGSLSFTITTFGSTASLTCDAGFSANSATIDCLDTGNWETPTCTIKDCGSSLTVSNGTLTFTSTTFGSTASLTCDTGFTASSATIDCLDTGSWETPTCTIKDCGSSLTVSNGTLTFTSTTFGSTASLSCDAGFAASSATIDCLDTGSWETPTCTIKDCGSSLTVSNGSLTFTSTTFGSTASVACDAGFTENSATIDCLDTGSWETPTCTIKDCGSSLTVSNGSLTFTSTTFGSTASVACDAGFTENSATIDCLDTGSWETPTCTIKDCGSSLTVSNGSLTFTSTTFGSTASVACDAGFTENRAIIDCLDTGSWEVPTCTIKDCGSFLTVYNGSLTFTSTTFGSTASLTCDAGFTANSATIDCLDTGSWETPTCTIKDCGSSLTVSNGSLTFTSTTFGSTASVACDAGFTANSAIIDCLDTGSWETPTCTIKDCSSSLTVSNGSLTFTSTTFGSTASVACDAGFTANSATIDCLDTGSWETPTCTIKDCGSSLTVSNGSLTFTSTTFGSTASVACDAGFTANSATIDCLDTGSWETPTCTIKDCGSSLTVSNGSLTFTSTTFGSTASVACDAGFTANSATIDCLDTGSWETPTCTIKDCGSSLTVSNGSLTFTSTTFGSTASVACDAGFTANSATIDCLDTGSWETPTCTIKDCGSSLTVSNGSLTFTSTTFGSTASLTCDAGFTENSATIDCLDTGSWETPTCSIKDCGSSLTVSNGSLTFTSTTFGSTASVACDAGFTENSATIDCLDTGSWEVPTCTIKDCGSSLTVSNGSLSFTSTTFGSTASLTCDAGFTENSATIDCLDTGSWETPTCTIKDCGSSLTVSNGSLTFTSTTFGSTASVACDAGYTANSATIDCLDTGSWETPTCTIKDCGSSLTVSNGSLTFTSTTFGSTASVACDAGFTANSVTIDCLDTGSWETPTCTIKDCGSSLTVSNGSLTFTSTTFGSTASVACDAGFTANSVTIDCLDTGSWETPTCTIKDCGSSLTVSNGSLTFTSTTFGSTASVACDAGFTANSATIDCLDTGSWEVPTCTIKDCGSSLTVSNGSLTFTSTTFGSTASVACDAGFTANSATIDCLDTGSWETPTCTIKDCGSSLTVSNGSLTFTSTTFGSTASVACDAGFTANSVTIDCLDTGSWETRTCTIKDCGSSLTVSNGSLTFTSTTFGSTASVACDAGFTANSATIDCLDTGSWEIPTCTIKDCGSSLTVSNGSLTFTSTTFGSTASVACDAGFTANSVTIDCLDTGSWETPTCTIKDCGSSLTVSNGSLTFTSTTFGSTASVACDAGFTANSATIDCLDTGSWEIPTCTIKDCGSSLTVSNGSLTFTSTTFGSTASVACDAGFTANSVTIDCLDTGSWETPTCTIKDCGSSLTVSKGSLTFTSTTFGSTASVSCDAGYTANSATIDCLDTGSWETPICTIKDCGSSLTVENGDLTFTSTTFGSTATLSCATGYKAGSEIINCLDTGSWETPTCTIEDCGTPSITNGNLEYTTTTYESYATITCNKGYTANRNKIKCKSTGDWQTGRCDIVDCGSSLPSITNGQATLDDPSLTTYESTATVTCNNGLTPDKSSIKCKSSGSWSKANCV